MCRRCGSSGCLLTFVLSLPRVDEVRGVVKSLGYLLDPPWLGEWQSTSGGTAGRTPKLWEQPRTKTGNDETRVTETKRVVTGTQRETRETPKRRVRVWRRTQEDLERHVYVCGHTPVDREWKSWVWLRRLTQSRRSGHLRLGVDTTTGRPSTTTCRQGPNQGQRRANWHYSWHPRSVLSVSLDSYSPRGSPDTRVVHVV